jgi:hypothetical protein
MKGGTMMEAKVLKNADKHVEATHAKSMDEVVDEWMESITNYMFKMIILLGIPYLLYVIVHFLHIK